MTVLGLARVWALVFSAGWGWAAAQSPEIPQVGSPERGKALLLQRQDSGCVL